MHDCIISGVISIDRINGLTFNILCNLHFIYDYNGHLTAHNYHLFLGILIKRKEIGKRWSRMQVL